MSDRVKTRIQAAWKHKRYLIVDEFSMIPKSLLQAMEKHVSIGKAGSSSYREEYTFGGVNVILCGDLHQFPPVAKGKFECLFTRQDPATDTENSALGRRIYEEFTTVVVLREQMRVTDPIWRDVLVHLRRGEIAQRHIDILRSLVLTNPDAAVNFVDGPWTEASLVTPRHAVRARWNQQAARKFAGDRQQVVFICSAEDTVKQGKDRSQALSLAERYAVACRAAGGRGNQRKELPREVELFVGMKVLVTNNLETDLDLTNGARGEVVGITLDSDEPPTSATSVVHLKKLPAFILVKMARTRASQLAGLPAAVVPVETVTTTFSIKLFTREGKSFQRTVHRRQFPVTPAYAFTDYRSQGQTLPYVIVDIATPPSGTLNLFNLYVALSRSSGRETIRLLRQFDDKLFLQSHDAALPLEDERLDALDRITKTWWGQMGGNERMMAMRAAGETTAVQA
ncbi:hypothetical protein PHLCEN_2v2028 [Hermanssonia centrifuga]|uniref:ATP-dependent DNA helicase n=1 Tax=Hermanssonia centrifuga TaxID=98765 RepID=A0A2R6RQB5_9APHY|nr:hypothetical protein PHLCEN_2v2028 [Hermanssonia centrifuga]